MTSCIADHLESAPDLDLGRPFTATMARAAGLTPRRLKALCDRGLLERPLRGVYVATSVPDSIDRRARCLSLVIPPGCFVTDRSAAWLHGAPMALAPNEDMIVPRVTFFRPSDAGRLRNPLCRSGERWVRPSDLMEVGGLVVTTPMRTAWDLGRLQHRDVALAGMDAVARASGFDLEEFRDGVRWFARQRGVVQLRQLADRIDPGAESFGESALRNRWWDAGLPRPCTQIVIFDDFGAARYRVDLGDEELGYGAEYDGAEFHEGRESLDEERRVWIASDRGFLIDSFTRDDVFGPQQQAGVRLRQGLISARASVGARRRTLALNRRLGGEQTPTGW